MTQTGVRTNIFGIGEVYELQREGLWVERNRETYREYGYYGMGAPFGSAGLTNVYRLDYSNDTNVLRVHNYLLTSYNVGAASGNSNFGYFGTGSINRIDYTNDTSTASVRGSLSLSRDRLAATGNSNFGYFGGGVVSGPTNLSTVDRVNYSNDLSTSSVRGPLSFARQSVGAAFSSKSHGYFSGGSLVLYVGPYLDVVDRINYANDSVTASIRGSLTASRRYAAGTGNCNYGYSGGGRVLPGNSNFSGVDRVDYSNDLVTTSSRGPLTVARTNPGATGNSNFGYFIGGFSSYIDRVDYSNDTVTASSRGKLDRDLYGGQATSSASFGGSPVSYLGAPWVATAPFGYFSGSALGALDRVDYTNDTAATTLRSQLSDTRDQLAATGNNNFGYFGGGRPTSTPSPTFTSTIDRINYSNDTAAVSSRGPLSLARRILSSTGNSNFGYFGGGAPGAVSTIDRTNYSNDTAIALVRGPLSVARHSPVATGNNNFGYFCAGYSPALSSPTSIIDRLDYSNDSVVATQRSSLTISTQGTTGATTNNNFGYFGGGSPGAISTVNRIDYANDTATASVRGPLSSSRSNIAATGNSNFGYFGGGASGPTISRVDRIDYSNDTQTASTRGPLSSSRYGLAASSSQAYGGAPNTSIDPLPAYIRNATKYNGSNTLDLPFKRVLGSYGYFGGGETAPVSSTVDRIDYSNDTATASVRGPLSSTRSREAATGNSNFGYFGGGRTTPSTTNISTVDRIDYSNDTATASVRGPLSRTLQNFEATGNSNFGYFGGGSPTTATIDRIDYSNDTQIASVRGPLSISRQGISATGNSNFGYFGGGTNPSVPAVFSTVDRIDYSNDSATASVRGPLSINRTLSAATGNSNFGYFGGGSTPTSVSTVDRIDYSNDTATASVRGPLSITSYFLSATGNSNFGYICAGEPIKSTVDRIDYSNDTETASVRGPLSLARRCLAASTNARSS